MNEINILLIEDNPADARLIKESLRDTIDNFHLEWKEGLFAGLAYLAKTDVDAILVDLNLPDSQGLETFTKINAKFPDKPIIVLTGLNDNELANRAVQEGAQDYLIKGEMDGALLDRCIRYSIERKKSETALREAEQAKQAAQARNAQYEQAVSMISDIVWRYDVNTKGEHVGSYISPVADRMLGLPAGTIGDSFEKYFSYVHPDDLPAMQKTLFEVIQTLGKEKTAEYRMLKADGTTLWVLSKGSAYGRFSVYGTTSDITEQKRAAEALRESEERFRTIFENNSAAMAIIERDTTISKVNKEYCKLGLFEEKDVIGISWTSQIPPEDLGRLLEYNRNRLIDPKSAPDKYEFMFNRKDGKIRHCLMSVAMIPTSQQIVCSFTDITERKQAEEALHESEAMVRKKLVAILEPEGDIGMLNLADILDIPAVQSLMDDFYRLTHIGIAIVDVHGKVLVAIGWQDICTKFHRVHPDTLKNCQESDVIFTRGVPTGTFKAYHCKNNLWDMATPIEVGGRHLGNVFFGQLFYEDVIPDYELFRSFARQHGFDETEYLAALDRVPRWNRETVDAIMAFYAKLAGMISSMSYNVVSLSRAISQNELALRQLGESEEKYRLLINNANESIIVAQDDQLKFVNPMTLDLLEDYSEQELIDRPFPEFIHPDDRNMVVENYRRRIANEAALPRYAFRVVTREGIVKWVEINAALIEWQGKPATLNFLTDITERMRAEKEVQALKTQMEFILGATKTGLDIIDAKFNIHYIDPEWKKVYGDYAGHKCYQYFMDRNTPCPDCGMVKALQTRSIIVTEEVLLKENSRPIQVTTIPFQNDAGEWLVAEVNVDIAERKQAEEDLRLSEERFRHLSEASFEAIAIHEEGVLLNANDQYFKMFGYEPGEALGKDMMTMTIAPEAKEFARKQIATDGLGPYESTGLRKDGTRFPMEVRARKMEYKGRTVRFAAIFDITERKRAEDELRRTNASLDSIIENIPNMIFLKDAWELRFVRFNRAGEDLLGNFRDDLLGKNDYDFFPKEQADFFTEKDREVLHRKKVVDIPEEPIQTRNKGERILHTKKVPILNEKGEPEYLLGISEDITERKMAEVALQNSEKKYQTLYNNMQEGVALHELVYDENGQAVEYKIVDTNPKFESILNITRDVVINKLSAQAYGTSSPPFLSQYSAVARSGIPHHFEALFPPLNKHLEISVSPWGSNGFATIFSDITERKHAEEALIKKSEDLARSNAELAQFAYVASHDLQEPLRMVTSYVQLLEKRYKGNLDPDADEFIGYAVEGAKRMKQLLRDLMDCSRVSTKYRPLLNVESETVLETTLQNLKIILEETKGTVTHDPLPVIMADETQMVQLFQNLIGNGLKFHGPQPPLIHVSAKQEGTNWVFSFQDNGKGIDPQYFEKIFVIFQRLQGRDKYPGTGIGLAIAKKIVERHGGQIWVDSKPEKGATFYFTIPVDGIKDGRG